MEITKTGMFSIVGRPNVGKSTLTNALAGEKIAIVSPKPQTTRNRIAAIVNRNGVQLVFMDTPGFHKPKTKLGDYMADVVDETVADTDAAVLVVEPREPGKQEKVLIGKISASGIPCALVINKIDTVEKASILTIIEKYSGLLNFFTIIPLCAKTGDGVDILMDELEKLCSPGPALYPEEMVTDQPEKAILGEFVREKLLKLLDREVPHGIAVDIERFEEAGEAVNVGAVIYCEKESHKGIIIGREGSKLKRVGELARADMERFLGAKVYLTLWVKVKEGWRDNEFYMRSFGYEQ